MEKYQTEAQEEIITIEIGKAVALVLDNLLDRWSNSENSFTFQLENDAEWHVLSVIKASIESQLGELFMPDYGEQVKRAVQKVINRWGKLDDYQTERLEDG